MCSATDTMRGIFASIASSIAAAARSAGTNSTVASGFTSSLACQVGISNEVSLDVNPNTADDIAAHLMN